MCTLAGDEPAAKVPRLASIGNQPYAADLIFDPRGNPIVIRAFLIPACALTISTVSLASAAEPNEGVAKTVSLEFKAMPIVTPEAPQQAVPQDDADLATLVARFGEQGSWRWNVQGGFGAEFEETDKRFGLGGLSFSYFIVDDFSIDFEFNGLYFDQPTAENAGGFNFNVLARWHVLAHDDWSLFVDVVGGVMETSDAVPAGGSSFNFVAQAGVGISFDISDDVRLLTGVRWHHISNGRTFDTNPSQDSLYVYAGLSFPF